MLIELLLASFKNILPRKHVHWKKPINILYAFLFEIQFASTTILGIRKLQLKYYVA